MDSANNLVKVSFYRQKEVPYGQSVYVAGEIPALGDWSPFRALKLKWSQGNNWCGEIYVQAPSDFEYKYFVSNTGEPKPDNITWEEGPNSKMSVPRRSSLLGTSGSINDIRVMSFNIRFDNPEDGANCWENRKDLVANVIKVYGCDFIGIQEALFNQVNDLQNRLPMYKWYGRGRDEKSEQGEGVPIFYLGDKWEIEEGNTFWLSETPTVPGSKTYGNTLPRICTWARFRNLKTGGKVFIYNCHLDHENSSSQRKSCAQIKQHMQKNCKGCENIILTGDLNVTPINEAIQIISNQEIKMKDSFNVGVNQSKATFHYWTGLDDGIRIDYIFAHESINIKEFRIAKDNFKNKYPSDHFPIISVLTLKSEDD